MSKCLPTTLPTSLPTGLPTDFNILLAHKCHKTFCNRNRTCLSIILGLKMICHYVSSLIEMFVLKGNNEEFARADSSSENLYRIFVILLIGWPFVYGGFLDYQFKHEDKYNYSLWGFKFASVILDVFLLAYTIYFKENLELVEHL